LIDELIMLNTQPSSPHPPSRSRPRAGRNQSGWTLIELMIGLVVLALLAAIALPAYQGQIRKLRRADAVATLLRIQQAQERLRMNQPNYAATLGSGGLGLPTSTPGGTYSLATSTSTETQASAYQVSAIAQGPQANDSSCRYLRISVSGGEISQQSGPDSNHANNAQNNRLCWNQ
jgi:prepilin-type N-terminal cleavage/methylation domain-containing protein